MKLNLIVMVERTFENGKVKVSVVDNDGKKYKIMNAMLYKTFTTNDHNHFDVYDLANLYKQNDELKKYFDKNTVTVLDMVKEIYNNKHEELVDLYSTTTNDSEKLLNTVELYDLGNSENITGGTYIAYVQVCDEEEMIFDVASSNVMSDTPVTVNQLVIDDAYLNNQSSSMDLFQTIVLMNALLSYDS